MKILETKGDLTKKEQYLMTSAPNIRKLSELKNQIVEVSLYCHYLADDGENEEGKPILAIMTPEGEVYATNSRTFIETFQKIIEIFGTEGFSKVLVSTGISRAGREFITAVYAD